MPPLSGVSFAGLLLASVYLALCLCQLLMWVPWWAANSPSLQTHPHNKDPCFGSSFCTVIVHPVASVPPGLLNWMLQSVLRGCSPTDNACSTLSCSEVQSPGLQTRPAEAECKISSSPIYTWAFKGSSVSPNGVKNIKTCITHKEDLGLTTHEWVTSQDCKPQYKEIFK